MANIIKFLYQTIWTRQVVSNWELASVVVADDDEGEAVGEAGLGAGIKNIGVDIKDGD